jgi:hypothetical protein
MPGIDSRAPDRTDTKQRVIRVSQALAGPLLQAGEPVAHLEGQSVR